MYARTRERMKKTQKPDATTGIFSVVKFRVLLLLGVDMGPPVAPPAQLLVLLKPASALFRTSDTFSQPVRFGFRQLARGRYVGGRDLLWAGVGEYLPAPRSIEM
jgi:hypothetical protein